ncbi:hypothetical protein BHM03_00008771 [Ensete ventricosum]|nr:hypothetical protein BHM03_00008771 [Ensete ventricosum]
MWAPLRRRSPTHADRLTGFRKDVCGSHGGAGGGGGGGRDRKGSEFATHLGLDALRLREGVRPAPSLVGIDCKDQRLRRRSCQT